MHTETYWNHNGKYESLANKLSAMIPREGAVNQPRKNPALEKFRCASNCYYDLYNNGLYNRVAQFRQVFGISSSQYKYGFGKFSKPMYDRVEEEMNRIVLRAAAEQGLLEVTEDGIKLPA